MRQFQRQVFRDLTIPAVALLEGATFERCTFHGGQIGYGSTRATLRHARLTDCRLKHKRVSCVCFDEVIVRNLKSGGMVHVINCLFRHVSFQGQFDKLFIEPSDYPRDPTPASYYASVDWALDISQAEFVELDLRGIPSPLVRRDPAHQVVVTRERALGRDGWKQITHYRGRIERMLRSTDRDEVFIVAGKRGKNAGIELEGIARLLELGVAC